MPLCDGVENHMKVGEVQEASGTKADGTETSAHRGGDRIRTLLEASRQKREDVANTVIEFSMENKFRL